MNLPKRFLFGLFCMVPFFPVHAQPQYFVDQPGNKISTMFGLNWEAITDKEFAKMAEGLLMKNGQSNARGATFLFEQCFSGGMLDDLEVTFGSTVRWVGGSAARHDEVSYGQGNSASFPMDHWVRALDTSLSIPILEFPMITHINNARALDAVGPNGSGKEMPQSIYRNGGENIVHTESIAASTGGHNAILWAGNANAIRHNNDIKVMYERLSADFAATGDPWSIIVLGDSNELGIPALAATKENLQAAFDAFQSIQGPNDEFLFFASDHGGVDTLVFDGLLNIGVGSLISRRISLAPAELEGIFETPEAIPGLVLDFDLLVGKGLRVFLDDVELADPFSSLDKFGQPFLNIDREILRRAGLDFEIRFINETGDRVILREAAFRTGGITNFTTAVPEAGSLVFMPVGGMIVAGVALYRSGGRLKTERI